MGMMMERAGRPESPQRGNDRKRRGAAPPTWLTPDKSLQSSALPSATLAPRSQLGQETS